MALVDSVADTPNWSQDSIYAPPPAPVETSLGLLFHPAYMRLARESAQRCKASGHRVTLLTCPRDVGIELVFEDRLHG